ncbi:MAG: S8 family serine peptidase [Ignavibacteria bacterium]|nr:S8 family serine peptidase [Ignavibacteria bacterium]
MKNKTKTLTFLLIIFLLPLKISYSQFGQEDIVITTVLKEKFFDKEGNPLTGKGVVVGDVDSGIDVFHPMFFFADGGNFEWIDTDGDGVFKPGKDAVDINKDGKANDDEILRYIEMTDNTFGMLETDPKKYNPDMDFLYVDKNNNRKRDYGLEDGFKESDPTYGEQFFISIDENKNNKLDVGEKLVALKTSKVKVVREKSGTIRRRGIDLIETEEDSIGHGTGVAGLILGGHYGVQKIHGIAPEAEIVMANIKYDYTPRFVKNFPDLVNFIREEKVNIMLFEDGEWTWEFLDGSTEEEEITNQMARDGITIVGGGGNLASGTMHIKDTIDNGEEVTYSISCPRNSQGKINDGVFISFLWRNPDSRLSFKVVTPDKDESLDLTEGSGFIKVGKYNVFYSRDVSPKGTVMFRLGFSEKDSGNVKGKWKIKVKSSGETIIDGYVVDVSQSWSGTSHWTSHVTDETTVTFPSTADSCIAVGAYVVNFGFFMGDKIGSLADYSGRGYNVTGKMGIDITAPGHSTFTTSTDNAYMIFSGTSSAAPHVVGAAALLLQYEPSLSHTQVRQLINKSATSDNFTGTVPNTNWGYGKLNIEGAITLLIQNTSK